MQPFPPSLATSPSQRRLPSLLWIPLMIMGPCGQEVMECAADKASCTHEENLTTASSLLQMAGKSQDPAWCFTLSRDDEGDFCQICKRLLHLPSLLHHFTNDSTPISVSLVVPMGQAISMAAPTATAQTSAAGASGPSPTTSHTVAAPQATSVHSRGDISPVFSASFANSCKSFSRASVVRSQQAGNVLQNPITVLVPFFQASLVTFLTEFQPSLPAFFGRVLAPVPKISGIVMSPVMIRLGLGD